MDRIEEIKKDVEECEKHGDGKVWEVEDVKDLLTALTERDKKMTEMTAILKTERNGRWSAIQRAEKAEIDNAELYHKLHLEMESSEHYSNKCYDLLCELDNKKRTREAVEKTAVKQNCLDSPKGTGFCDNCANGQPELCRYVNTVGAMKLIDELKLKSKNDTQQIEILTSALHPCPSPCGHSSQYAYTTDKGKHIVCLLCKVEVHERKISELRNTCNAFEDSFRSWSKTNNNNLERAMRLEKILAVAKKKLERIIEEIPENPKLPIIILIKDLVEETLKEMKGENKDGQ